MHFNSQFINFEDWLVDLEVTLPSPITPVCYQGNFATTVSRARKHSILWRGEDMLMAKWRTERGRFIHTANWACCRHLSFTDVAERLERGDNIEEAHFVERMWAGILSGENSDSY